MNAIQEMRDSGQSWKYTSVLLDEGKRRKLKATVDGDGNPIDIVIHEGIDRIIERNLPARKAGKEQLHIEQYLYEDIFGRQCPDQY